MWKLNQGIYVRVLYLNPRKGSSVQINPDGFTIRTCQSSDVVCLNN